MRVVVVGGGYVGLVVAACLATAGHDVVIVEQDTGRRESVRRGRAPITEPGLDDLLAEGLRARRLRVVEAIAAAGAAEVVVLAVGTPAGPGGGVDVGAVVEAYDACAPWVEPGGVVVVKSTVPPGTTDALRARGGADGPEVVCCPEFLVEGMAVQSFRCPDRLVLGGGSGAARGAVERMLRAVVGVSPPALHVASRDAELAKLASNAALAVRVALINEIAVVCDAVGADIDAVAAVVGADRRVGPAYLRAGPGFGGSCLPKDVAGLGALLRAATGTEGLLGATLEANRRHRQRPVDVAHAELARVRADGLRGARVAVWGVAFKASTDDVRESPSVSLCRGLGDAGAEVVVWDRAARDTGGRALGDSVTWRDEPLEAARGADLLVVMTEWPELCALDARAVAQHLRHRIVLDARNALDAPSYAAAGFRYVGTGRGRPGEPQEPR